VGISIGYVDGPRLRRSLLAAAEWVGAGRDELNRINVFPVPDGDTGTNFTLTMRSIAEAIHRLRPDATLAEVAHTAAEASVMGARGNSGILLSHFVVGFREAVGERLSMTAQELAGALRRGFQRLEEALSNPREGTILTVARAAAEGAELAAEEEKDLYHVVQRTLRHSEEALRRTPELLAVLKHAGVVDAGGKGFVRVLEGIMRLIHGHPLREVEMPRLVGAAPAAVVQVEQEEDYRFCTEVLVRGDALPGSPEVRSAIAGLGGSVQVVRTEDLLRVHIHLDEPQRLFDLAAGWGEVLNTKADDMREQHRMLAVETSQPAIVVADSACDLPDEVLDRYGIGLVPLQLILGDTVLEDRVAITPREFYARLRQGDVQASTSQPTPAAFAAAFEHARASADEVVAVVLSSGLSGTWANAMEARRTFGPGGVHVVDSRSASFGTGLLALRGAELAEEGWSGSAIAAELERIRDRSGILLTVDTLDNLIRSGRISRLKGRLASWLDVKPILTLDRKGRVEPADRVRGRDAVLPRVIQIMERRIPAGTQRLRIGIAHVDCPDVAEEVRGAVVARFEPYEVLVWPATPVLATHAGLGAWAVFWSVEDGGPPAGRNKRAPGAL
jgi:DegV family protein with EDD domain